MAARQEAGHLLTGWEWKTMTGALFFNHLHMFRSHDCFLPSGENTTKSYSEFRAGVGMWSLGHFFFFLFWYCIIVTQCSLSKGQVLSPVTSPPLWAAVPLDHLPRLLPPCDNNRPAFWGGRRKSGRRKDAQICLLIIIAPTPRADAQWEAAALFLGEIHNSSFSF